MRLNEFKITPMSFKGVLTGLQQRFGLKRVGGNQRIYRVGDELGVVYLVRGGPKAVGFTWQHGDATLRRVYLWNNFNASHSPDLVVDIPPTLDLENGLRELATFIDGPRTGVFEAAAPITTIAALVALVKAEGRDPKAISAEELNRIVGSTGHILSAHLADHLPATGTIDLTAEVERPMAVTIMARAANGVMFEVPGSAEIASRVAKQMAAAAGGSGETMEQQYEKLRAKVRLVASGKSSYIKSLLITGAPSAGKTYSVMQVIKELGLQEGSDYIVIKGSITDVACYQTLIEQIDGLTIFDDCDSVVSTVNGKNMMKNALDTYAIRDINRPTNNSINTKVMPEEERTIFVDAMSRVLRGVASADDLLHFERFAVKKKKDEKAPKKSPYINDDGDFFIPDLTGELEVLDDDNASLQDRMHELQQYFSKHLPNKIDYRGRIIFISNMMESDWDSAILTRAFRQNMNFADGEMLDFLDKIKDTIAAPGLSSSDKAEVMAHIRTMYEAGQLHSPINFRLVQQCYDLRLTGDGWQQMMIGL
jgi:hypothetical protein